MHKERAKLMDMQFENYCRNQLGRLRTAALGLVEKQGKPYIPSPDYERIVKLFFENSGDIRMFNSLRDPRLSLVTSKIAKREMTPQVRVYAAGNEGKNPSVMAVLSSKSSHASRDLIHAAIFSPKNTEDPYMTKVAHRYAPDVVNFVSFLQLEHRHYANLLLACMEGLLQVITPDASSQEAERNV